jgi:DNA-binding NarL/FixJ family response regulator
MARGQGSAVHCSVVVGEPHPSTRLALHRRLTDHGFSVLGEGVDVSETIGLALAHPPAICLLAGDLPGGAATAVAVIDTATPGTRTVVLAKRESVPEALECIRAGAAGYLSKDIAGDALARAIRGVIQGEVALSRTMTRRVLAELRAADPNDVTLAAGGWSRTLTVRELQVLHLLSRGASTVEIADILSISPITARRHCSELCRKLGVPDRAALVALWR